MSATTVIKAWLDGSDSAIAALGAVHSLMRRNGRYAKRPEFPLISSAFCPRSTMVTQNEDGEAADSYCMASLGKLREQITGIVGGQIVPATNTPLLTSASTRWSGFLLEKHTAADRQNISWGWHRTHVSLITKGRLSFRVRSTRGDQDFIGRAGSVCVFPSGFDETRFFIAGSKFEAIVVELDPARLEKLLGNKDAAATAKLAPQILVEDPFIAALLREMASEVTRGCPAGPLYGQGLSVSLAIYLARGLL